MIRNRRIKSQMITMTFILIVLFSSISIIFLINNSNSETDFNEIVDEVDDILQKHIEDPRISKISSASWWNSSWQYRRLINITNPNTAFSFTNYTTSVVFNYTVHTNKYGEPDYPMNGDLSDIRIVQDGKLRKYYYQKDYPYTDFVTVWFEVDIGASPNHIDTDNIFLYFNGTATGTDPDYYIDDTASSNKKDAMGWVRNGDFELDYVSGDHILGVFGWTYTNASPSSFDDGSGELEESPPNYVNKLTDSNDYQERAFGNWSFKWGDTGQYLEDEDTPEDGHDFEGTLYSHPFIVPTVEGTGVDLELEVFRNFRCYNTQPSHLQGFYIRLCEDYSSDLDAHSQYILKEQYRANEDPTETYVVDVISGIDSYDTRNDASQPYENDGELTGTITIDLDTDDMGKLLFLEVGTYGKESDKHAAFTQVDNVKFNYEIDTTINDEVQEVAGEATFITKDVDGRIVPNAEVTIIEESSLHGPFTEETSEEDGSFTFSNVPQGTYNVTVNYTIQSTGLEECVYNNTGFYISGSGTVYELKLNMSTIDFEIVDYGGYPLTYGYINVSYSEGSTVLDTLQLENDGKTTFRWLNRSFYYYQVFYNNTDYSQNPTSLNASYIWRENYSKYPDGNKTQSHTLDINKNNQASPSGQFNVKERIYTNNSMIQISDIKLINVSITIQNNHPLTNVSVYYIDSSNETDTLDHRIFFDDSYGGETDDNITIDLMNSVETVNSKLSSENRLAYGLLVDVWGVNSSVCTGNIEINTTEAWHVFNKTAISKLYIKVLGDGATISDAIVSINSTSKILGHFVNTTLISDKNRGSFAFSDNDLPFMFLRGYKYNFTVRWEGAQVRDTFNVSSSDQWVPAVPPYLKWYNYSLLTYNSTLEFNISMGGIDASDYKLKFDNLSAPESVIWQNNVSIGVFFNKTVDDWAHWSNVTDPDLIELKIQLGTDILFTFKMEKTGTPGYYMKEFNSSILSAGISGVFYKLVITGSRSPYTLQGDEITTLYVTGKGTVLSLHDYNSLNVITTVSQKFGELVNITVKYYNNSNSPLKGASITYEWLGLDPIQIYEDPINDGYYTATIDTSIAEVWGSRSIEIVARLENYTAQTILFSLSITERSTSLNGEIDLVYISSKVWVEDPNPFELVFKDSLTGDNIGNLTTASYTWEELYANGSRIPGVSGTGFLTQNGDNTHTLDFHTEVRSIGFYYLYVTLHKQNYKARSALINVEIMSRIFNYTFPSEEIDDDILTIRNGDPLELDLTLHDMSRDIPLENATISMDYQNVIYTFSEGINGSYSLEITDYTRLTENETSSTSTTGIIISKANFTTQIIDITIILNNRIFNLSISKPYKDNLITIISGDRLYFDIRLRDFYDDSQILDGTISLTIGGEAYEDLSIINNGDGTYTITFLSYPEAFTSTKTLSGEIIIQKTNFKTIRIPITIEIKMTEIFPGMPTFYFIIIIVSIIGILGSIVAYRVIQQARIPNHVKKIRKVKGLIKAKKKITEIIYVPSKVEILAKLFGNDWKQIDLSIEKSLGIEELKKQQPIKQPTIKDKTKEQRGDVE